MHGASPTPDDQGDAPPTLAALADADDDDDVMVCACMYVCMLLLYFTLVLFSDRV